MVVWIFMAGKVMGEGIHHEAARPIMSFGSTGQMPDIFLAPYSFDLWA
jgi:hypothetical protein